MTREEIKKLSTEHDYYLEMSRWCMKMAGDLGKNDPSSFYFWMSKSEDYTKKAVDISYKMFDEMLSDMKGDE